MRFASALVLFTSLLAVAGEPPKCCPGAEVPERIRERDSAPAGWQLTGWAFPLRADPAPQPKANQLGRAIPKKQYDYGRFRAVVGQDGKTRYFPRLSKHVDSAKRAAPLPDSVDWSAKAKNVIKRMYLNDQYGDCVLASRYHQGGIQTAADTGTGIEADDAEVYAAYQAACGRGDNGCDMSAVNNYQQSVGLKYKGVVHKSDGSVSIDHTNKELVKAAIYVFGGLNVGFSLPNDWYSSPDGSDWGPTNSRIVGGHEVQAFGYDDKGVWISTWGGTRRILWSAFTSTRWLDEVYATLSADWYGTDRVAPSGIDAVTLKVDLALVANGQIPPLPEPNPPTPPVPPPPPPPPGKGFTGTITVTTTTAYKDGVKGATTENTSVSATGTPGGLDQAAIGVNPAIVADVLQLLADIRAKKPKDVIFADLLKILADLAP